MVTMWSELFDIFRPVRNSGTLKQFLIQTEGCTLGTSVFHTCFAVFYLDGSE